MTLPIIENAVLMVVRDPTTGRLRVKPMSDLLDGFVRFPQHLRAEGYRFIVERLKPIQGNKAWCAVGKIERVA